MSTIRDVSEAIANLCAVLSQERAYIETGDVLALLDLRPRKAAALDNWRAQVAALEPGTPVHIDLCREALEIETYAKKNLDLMSELLAERALRAAHRGSA